MAVKLTKTQKQDYQLFKQQSDYLNKLNKQSAQAQMDFQERLSNTSHQREVADLQKAGLNPVLSANNGASTTSGSYANVDSSPISAYAQNLATQRNINAQLKMNRLQLANAYKIARMQAQMQYAASIYATDRSFELGTYQSDNSLYATRLTNQTSAENTEKNVRQNPSLYGLIAQGVEGAVGLLTGKRSNSSKGLSSLYNSNNIKAFKKRATDSLKAYGQRNLENFEGDIGYIPQGKLIGADGLPMSYSSARKYVMGLNYKSSNKKQKELWNKYRQLAGINRKRKQISTYK